MSGSVLVAGVGNIFLGDDAFGVETVHELEHRVLPDGVTVKDFGIRGFDLAYALLEPWHTVIMVDAMPHGQRPGTLSLLEPDLGDFSDPNATGIDLNPHWMSPIQVLNLAASLGPVHARVLVLGCEPFDFGDELEGRIGLSPVVAATVENAVQMLEEIAIEALQRQRDFAATER